MSDRDDKIHKVKHGTQMQVLLTGVRTGNPPVTEQLVEAAIAEAVDTCEGKPAKAEPVPSKSDDKPAFKTPVLDKTDAPLPRNDPKPKSPITNEPSKTA